ncbi:MAG: hypothetical protein KF773_15215 [Deltaproteobacteria bacterium]|nr:hypothetical protein [Deltaproteobacteria bacterium]
MPIRSTGRRDRGHDDSGYRAYRDPYDDHHRSGDDPRYEARHDDYGRLDEDRMYGGDEPRWRREPTSYGGGRRDEPASYGEPHRRDPYLPPDLYGPYDPYGPGPRWYRRDETSSRGGYEDRYGRRDMAPSTPWRHDEELDRERYLRPDPDDERFEAQRRAYAWSRARERADDLRSIQERERERARYARR